jgi:hypothetical protein
MGQTRFQYNDITAARKIHTAMRRSLNHSQKPVTITNCFSKQTLIVKKKTNIENPLNETFWIIHIFRLFMQLFPFITPDNWKFITF